jgi:hypothetical protein
MTATIGSGDRKDFDETRRLLYMALLAPRTKRYNLAGTLVNALVHHHAVDGLDADEAITHVLGVVEADDDPESREWMRQQIDRITAELGD